MCENCLRLQRIVLARGGATQRVYETFETWKNRQIPDDVAFYHTALDIKYRHGGLSERIALLRLRQQGTLIGRLDHLFSLAFHSKNFGTPTNPSQGF